MNLSLSGPLGGLAVVIAIVAIVVYASRAGAAMEKAWKERLARARRARATVVSTRRGTGAIRQGGHHAPEVILELQVEGRIVTARWHVFELGLARIVDGATVPVRIDAENPDLLYPGEDWAELSFSQRHALGAR